LANRAFARLFQIGGDVRGQTLLEALRLHELTDLVDELSEKREPLQLELRLPGPSERWLQVNAAAIASPDNERPAALLVFHDLTRLKQLERTREEFVANVSHELRTPLSLIKGYAETLLDGAKDKPEVATRFLQTIDRNAERLKLLIEDLLTISALESGSIQLELQSVDLPALIEKVFADFRTRAHARRVRLLNQTSDLKVNADPRRLEQVLSNLIDNAIKYGRPEGQVTLGARSLAGQQVEVFVRDDGPGIPPDALDRIFERYYRVDKARSRDQGGTGLGLSIVKHIVQSHGGRIWAESSPGNGATFFFTLPQ
jgi:two-component system phosphate regulon sensor histidine kinase PhoR